MPQDEKSLQKQQQKQRGTGFKLFALLKMEGKPRRDCTQKTERGRSPEKRRRCPQITTLETTFTRSLVKGTDKKEEWKTTQR